MKRVELAGLAVESTVGAPVVVLREHDEPHRVLPIFVGGAEATAIALAAMGEEPPRPMTHDLMAEAIRSLGGLLEAVEVTGLDGGTFVATLAMTGPTGELRIDARPSDAIALALRLVAPVFVSDSVLEEAGSFPALELDDAAIDDAVEEFRSFLDDVDASHFEADRPGAEALDDVIAGIDVGEADDGQTDDGDDIAEAEIVDDEIEPDADGS